MRRGEAADDVCASGFPDGVAICDGTRRGRRAEVGVVRGKEDPKNVPTGSSRTTVRTAELRVSRRTRERVFELVYRLYRLVLAERGHHIDHGDVETRFAPVGFSRNVRSVDSHVLEQLAEDVSLLLYDLV